MSVEKPLPHGAESVDPEVRQAAALLGGRGGRATARHPRRVEIARKAGLASGKARREKAQARKESK